MKTFYSIATSAAWTIASSGLLLSWSGLPVQAANPAGCVTNFDASTDYFPDKSEVTLSQQYTLEYHNNYKIVTVPSSEASYLLVQCGTTLPESVNQSAFTHVMTIPLTSFGATTSTFIPFFEQLGLRHLQAAHQGQADFFVGACFNELVDDGEITLVDPSSGGINNETYIAELGIPQDTPFFVGPFDPSSMDTNIIVSEYTDRSNLAVYEWIKYFGVFFNKEKEANAAFDTAKARYECASDNAELLQANVAEDDKPTVVWASYSDFPGFEGFYSANACPNYYCEVAEICGANLLIRAGSMNISAFIEFAGEADIWMYSGTNVQTALNLFPELQNLTAVQSGQVFDINGHGEDAWLNDRQVEPDALLEDFCHMVGTDNPNSPHDPAFLRNIDNPEKTVGECTDQCNPYNRLGSICEPIGSVVASAEADSTELPQNCAPQDTSTAPPQSPGCIVAFLACVLSAVVMLI